MSLTDLESRIDDWVQSNAEWVDDSVDHVLKERNTELDGSGETYYSIDVRFLQEDTKDNILQKFTDKLENKVGWYRVGFHSCEHHNIVTGEIFTAELSSAVQLERSDIIPQSESIHDSNGDYFGYAIDYERGTITAHTDRDLVDGQTYKIDYEFQGSPCPWDDSTEWTDTNVTIPTGVETFNVEE